MNDELVLAFDIGGSKLLCGLVSRNAEVIDREKLSVIGEMTAERLEPMLISMAERLIKRNPGRKLIAAGLNVPGLADPEAGIWLYAPFSNIRDYDVAGCMSKRLGLPVYIENDVNACAWAEKVYGACTDIDDFLWVTISNGIGGGLVLNGRIYRGTFGGAAEFGHITIDPNGLKCPCGHVGCMEATAAGPAIRRRYAYQAGIPFDEAPTADKIAKLYAAGDDIAIKVLSDTGEYIGRALSFAANLLNLPRYVLGGGVMQSFSILEPHIRRAFFKYAFELPNRTAEIIPSALGYEAALIGAAALAWVPPYQ